MRTAKKRIGRPLKQPVAGKRMSLGLKVTSEVKAKLDHAAQASGRTQSQEAEARLERSFQNEDLLPQLMELAYGRQAAGLLIILGRITRDAGSAAAFYSKGTLEAVENWMNEPWAFEQVRLGIMAALDGLRPEGEPIAPALMEGLPVGPGPAAVRSLGESVAGAVLEAVANTDRGGDIGRWAEPVRERLAAVQAHIKVPAGPVVISGLRPGRLS